MMTAGLPAQIRYDTPEFEVIRRGDFVLCAVSGDRIALKDLKYWSSALQEAYRGAEEATAAMLAGGADKIVRP